MSGPTVLDACCGSRMMWFDKQDPRALFGDVRSEQVKLSDGRLLRVSPDVQLDFTALPFPDETFRLVAFDPPHLNHLGHRSWLAAKYGALSVSWREELSEGFTECFRVLKPWGTLVFKWAETQIPLSEVLALTPHKPLFGHTTTNRSITHWMCFLKEDES